MRTLDTFVLKFRNDWSLHLAEMLAFSLVLAVFPLLLALLSLGGLLLTAVSPASLHRLARTLTNALPAQVHPLINVPHLLAHVIRLSGPLALIALLGLVWTGANLFTRMEHAFRIVFRTGTRPFIQQKLMALGMVGLLAVLLPLSALAAGLVDAGSQAVQALLPAPLARVLTISGPLLALGILWVLFVAIYRVVPTRAVPLTDAWRGALVAALLCAMLQLVFPLYFQLVPDGAARYGAAALALVVLVVWLWLFAIILMIGAQVNAVAMGLSPTPYDLPHLVCRASGPPMTPPAARGAAGSRRP